MTTTIIACDTIRLPPTLQPERVTDSPYGVISNRLSDLLSFDLMSEDELIAAQRKARRWAGENRRYLTESIGVFTGLNKTNINPDASAWLDVNKRIEWSERISRRGSIFDKNFLFQIAYAIDIELGDLLKIYDLSSKPGYIKDIVDNNRYSEEVIILENAFVASFLIRGHYYDSISRKMKQHIMFHPLRDPLYKVSANAKSIPISNFETYLSNIVLSASFVESEPRARAARWVDNVKRLRNERNRINFSPRQSDEIALKDAIEIAKRMHIFTHKKELEWFFNVTVGFCIGIPTALFLDTFSGVVAGVLLSSGAREVNLDSKMSELYSNRKSRLNDLAQLGPGRLALISKAQPK